MAASSSTGSGSRPLSIGSVTFLSEECPDRLPIGALVSRLVITELFGGGRSTMDVGVQPKPVSWRGTFYEDVDSKVGYLYAIMTLAQEVLLTYGSQSWYAKVTDFTPDYAFLDTIYDITVEITRSATGSLGGPSAASATSQNTNLLAAVANDAPADFDPSSVSLNMAAKSLTSASTLAQIQTVLAQAQKYAAVLSTVDPKFDSINSMIDNLTLLSANIVAAQTSASIQVTGGTMFDVAAQYCGDASKAFAIMSANGLFSPTLSSKISTLLYIPQALRSSAVVHG